MESSLVLELIYNMNNTVIASSATIISPAVIVSVQYILDRKLQLFIDESVEVKVAVSLLSVIDPNSGSLATTESNLTGTTMVNVHCGNAEFSDLKINLVGSYRFVFAFVDTVFSNMSVASDVFRVLPGAAAYLVIVQPPTGVRPIWPFQRQPIVEIRDNGGNLVVNATIIITASIASVDQSSTSGAGQLAFISNTRSVAARAGVADFSGVPCPLCEGPLKSGLALSLPFGGARLRFSAPAVAPAESTPFDVSLWPPVRLSVAALPAAAQSGVPFPAVVSLLDSFGHLVTWADAGEQTNVTARLRLRVNTPNTLQGALLVQAARGVAAFTDLSIGYAGAGYLFDFAATTTLSQARSHSNAPAHAATPPHGPECVKGPLAKRCRRVNDSDEVVPVIIGGSICHSRVNTPVPSRLSPDGHSEQLRVTLSHSRTCQGHAQRAKGPPRRSRRTARPLPSRRPG